MRITICGGGNAAHTAAGLFAACEEYRVNVYLSFEKEAQSWREGVLARGGIFVKGEKSSSLGRPELISADPAEAIPGSQIVILALPAFAHETVLREIGAYLDDGAWLGALAARGCFDLAAKGALSEKTERVKLFGLQTLPWACRVREYGQAVDILGTKVGVDMAVSYREGADELAASLGECMGLRLKLIENFFSLTLAGTGQLIHPGVMYGLFRNWDGALFDKAPYFYQGIDEGTSEVLQAMGDEVQSLRADLERLYPNLDLSAVRPLDEWLRRSYGDDIQDVSSLQVSFTSNRSYAGLRAPMRVVDGGLAPDFKARYLAEDVPYALLATRGIAALAGTPTPMIDSVILWAQERLEKEYLLDGALTGTDIVSTRAPQRFGLDTLDKLMFFSEALNRENEQNS
jgi:hypothetical protein